MARNWTEADSMDEDLEHHLARIPEYGDRVLRVIVDVQAELPRIVTVYLDRRRGGR